MLKVLSIYNCCNLYKMGESRDITIRESHVWQLDVTFLLTIPHYIHIISLQIYFLYLLLKGKCNSRTFKRHPIQAQTTSIQPQIYNNCTRALTKCIQIPTWPIVIGAKTLRHLFACLASERFFFLFYAT